ADDPGGERDRVAAQAVGVAVAVPALMRAAHDGGHARRQGLHARRQALALGHVRAHQLLLGGVERTGLGQDRRRDRELAEVVQQPAELDVAAHHAGEAQLVGDLDGQHRHAAGMAGQVGVETVDELERAAAQAATVDQALTGRRPPAPPAPPAGKRSHVVRAVFAQSAGSHAPGGQMYRLRAQSCAGMTRARQRCRALVNVFRPTVLASSDLRSTSHCAVYIIPDMSGMPAPAPSFSGISATIASVVRMFLAIDAAFCSAERVTIAGSITPAATRSSISPVAALRPCPAGALRTSLTTTEPSRPELLAIWRSGSSSARRTIRAPVRSSSSSNASGWTASDACSR